MSITFTDKIMKASLKLKTFPSVLHRSGSEVFDISGESKVNRKTERTPSGTATSGRVKPKIIQEAIQQRKRTSVTHILDLPVRLTKYILTFLPLDDLTSCMLVCSAWCNVLSDENITVWKIHCIRRLGLGLLESDYLQHCKSYKSKLRALIHSWNPYDCSPNATVDAFTLTRGQVPRSTDGCRGRIGFREGRHVWEIVFLDPLGSVATVGVATHSTVLTHEGYGPLIGNDRHSWGWNIVSNILVHKRDSYSYYPNDPKIRYKVGETIRMILDCEDKTLSFERSGEFLGIAFRELPTPKKELYPAVSIVYGGARVLLVYLGNFRPDSPRRPKR